MNPAAQVDLHAFLKSTPDLYLIFTPDFKIVAASSSYLEAIKKDLDAIIGRIAYEVIPPNPDDIGNDVIAHARASVNHVVQHKVSDVMGIQRYDIQRPKSEGGEYEEHYWSVINSPIFDSNNNVAYILHRAEDVTRYVKLKERAGNQEKLVDSFKDYVDRVENEIYKRAQQLQASNKKLHAINEELTATKTRLTQINTTLKLNQKKFQLIVESTKDYAISMLSPEGEVTTWNAGAEKITGYQENEIIGKHFSIFYPAEKTNRDIPGLGIELSKINGRHEEQGWRVRKSGELYFANVTTTALHDEDGSLIGFSKIIRDMTEVKKSEKLKSEFISVVSHELRTPLTSIQGSLNLLLNGILGSFPEKARKILKLAYRNSERLATLVNDILDIEKIESGLMEMVLEEVNLINLIQDVIETDLAYAEKFNVSINFINPMTEIFVNVDPKRLTQVITNLLSNAIKFSPKQAIVDIALNIRPDENKVRVNVIDRGPGIDEDFKNRIFQKFCQADSSSKRKHDGTGLGLSISKALTEKLGSSLEFSTEIGKGSCFYFDLTIVKCFAETQGSEMTPLLFHSHGE